MADYFLLGAEPMVNFEDAAAKTEDGGNADEENYKGGPSCKKRRLSPGQVQHLESSFDEENKLEPEKKAQLAKELGLQPRQVAIWFQNRRARLRSKQLEKKYDELNDRYSKLKADFKGLLKEKEELKEEVLLLKEKLLINEKEKTIGPSLSVQLENASSVKVEDQDEGRGLPLEPASSSCGVFELNCSDLSREEGDNLVLAVLEHGFMAELDEQLWCWPD
ncbi:hypothetical protein SAY87_024956 [Trapa incisa]|uniref:Homeobox-leucine zipper protein n=1 Tax=Trapa incisa TaxID=236973 RepID=A0AAN7JGC0_9MYRT|nr:hypothetical protein SAY87_024956 [Trapa incisa]